MLADRATEQGSLFVRTTLCLYLCHDCKLLMSSASSRPHRRTLPSQRVGFVNSVLVIAACWLAGGHPIVAYEAHHGAADISLLGLVQVRVICFPRRHRIASLARLPLSVRIQDALTPRRTTFSRALCQNRRVREPQSVPPVDGYTCSDAPPADDWLACTVCCTDSARLANTKWPPTWRASEGTRFRPRCGSVGGVTRRRTLGVKARSTAACTFIHHEVVADIECVPQLRTSHTGKNENALADALNDKNCLSFALMRHGGGADGRFVTYRLRIGPPLPLRRLH